MLTFINASIMLTLSMLSRHVHIHRQSFPFDARGHRTGVHTDETSTPLEGPWTPLQQPYSISHRAGREALSPARSP